MPFVSPLYIAPPPGPPPDSLSIPEFLFGSGHGRYPIAESRSPFTCGLTGKTYSAVEVAARVEHLAAALGADLDVQVNTGSELDKVVALFGYNTVDTLTVSWATHRLSGASAPVSPAYSVEELTRQLASVRAKAVFTCASLLSAAKEAAANVGIDAARIYLLDGTAAGHKTVDELITEGGKRTLPPLQWQPGQGAKQTAYLCASSGTSGLPKNVQISHHNVIANVMQIAAFESNYIKDRLLGNLGVLPMSHSYALIVTGHLGVYRGHQMVVLPAFNIHDVVEAIVTHRLEMLWMVPPMVVGLIKAAALLQKHDLCCVEQVTVAASNLTREVADAFRKLMPNSTFVQGYGLTEAAVGVSFQNRADLMAGSCGSLFPLFEVRLVDAKGDDVVAYDAPGELWLKSPSIMLGYLDNEQATANAFCDGWLRTGDLMQVRLSDKGYEHFFIVDRVKELIKVRGLQVSPVEVESLLAAHPGVADVVVVPIPNDAAGELPVAFVVRSPEGKEDSDAGLKRKLNEHVSRLADYKQLAGGVYFEDALPKSASGKTKRGEMKERAKAIYERGREKKEPKVLYTVTFDSDEE